MNILSINKEAYKRISHTIGLIYLCRSLSEELVVMNAPWLSLVFRIAIVQSAASTPRDGLDFYFYGTTYKAWGGKTRPLIYSYYMSL